MSRVFRTLLLAVPVLAALAALGCTDAGTPTSLVAPAGAARSVASGPDLTPIARFNQKPQVTIAWAKKWIGPAGGRLDFQGFSIVVPPGAVSRVTQFSIRLPVDPRGSERVVAEFGPHGTGFAVPVKIGFPLRGTSIEGSASPTIVWWNSGWQDVGGVVTADGSRIETSTSHFSEYGTTDEARFGNTISTSGG